MTSPSKKPKATVFAVAGVLLMLSGPASYALLFEYPLVRSTGASVFALMSAGAVLGLAAAWIDRRHVIRILFGLDVALLSLAVFGFFAFAALPETPAFADLKSAPDFTLNDHVGNPVTLGELRTAGPVLLVFYRGHW